MTAAEALGLFESKDLSPFTLYRTEDAASLQMLSDLKGRLEEVPRPDAGAPASSAPAASISEAGHVPWSGGRDEVVVLSCPECRRRFGLSVFSLGELPDRTSVHGDSTGTGETTGPIMDDLAIDDHPVQVAATGDEASLASEGDPADILEFAVDGNLDLRAFVAGDIEYLVPDYLKDCREKGILKVRIVHGGEMGETMESLTETLETLPEVESYESYGSQDNLMTTLVRCAHEKRRIPDRPQNRRRGEEALRTGGPGAPPSSKDQPFRSLSVRRRRTIRDGPTLEEPARCSRSARSDRVSSGAGFTYPRSVSYTTHLRAEGRNATA